MIAVTLFQTVKLLNDINTLYPHYNDHIHSPLIKIYYSLISKSQKMRVLAVVEGVLVLLQNTAFVIKTWDKRVALL